MSTTNPGKPDFAEQMARSGFDPHDEHPDLKPDTMPVYLGRGEWGRPMPVAPEDDGGYGPEEDTSWMDGQ